MLEVFRGALTINQIGVLFIVLICAILVLFAIVEYNIDTIKRNKRINRKRK